LAGAGELAGNRRFGHIGWHFNFNPLEISMHLKEFWMRNLGGPPFMSRSSGEGGIERFIQWNYDGAETAVRLAAICLGAAEDIDSFLSPAVQDAIPALGEFGLLLRRDFLVKGLPERHPVCL
jgi:hypothetical protein